MPLTGENHEPSATIRWEMLVFIRHTPAEGLCSVRALAGRWAAVGNRQGRPPLMGHSSQEARQSQVAKRQINKILTGRDSCPNEDRESGQHLRSVLAEVWAGSPR